MPQNAVSLQTKALPARSQAICDHQLIFRPVHPNDCEIESKCLLGDCVGVNRVRSVRHQSEDRYDDLATAQGLWGARRNIVGDACHSDRRGGGAVS